MVNKISILFLTAASLFLSGQSSFAQDRCSTTKYEQMRRNKKPGRETPAQFEQWIQSMMADQTPGLPEITAAGTIPVVVHILHNGVSDPTNISDAQVASQLDALNKDFRRLNTDANLTPAEFAPAAGATSLVFTLAKRDPEGLPTNGITRTLATKTQWQLEDQSELKALSYWPAEDYLNIWVINFGTNDIGFAQFPVTNLIQGLDGASEDRLTDGVVIDYRAFGVSGSFGTFDLFPRFNKGRTATHEIGHFFGLRHIWGDVSSCADNDFVPDTPFQLAPSSFCPTYPITSCTTNKMFMNYMDYTDDVCMNLFTNGQISRFDVVLGASPRRASLLTSVGATVPVIAANDAGIRSLVAPGTTNCTSPMTPQVEIRNYGSNVITSIVVELRIDGVVNQTKTFNVNLASNALATVSFDPVSFSVGTSRQFLFTITQTNGVADGNSQNNIKSVLATVPAATSLPILQSFDAVPSDWQIFNPDNQITWTNVLAPDGSASNRAMKMDFYNYDNSGVLDKIVTPSFTLSTPGVAQLRFDISYAQFSGQNGDALRVYALPLCSSDPAQAILLYDKSGAALATAAATSQSFVPSSASQWRKSEVVSLATLNNPIPYQIAFVGRNGFGNNLYLDNVVVTETDINDLAFIGVVSPGIVHCVDKPVISFQVMNLGTSDVTNFKIDYKVNSDAVTTQSFSNVLIQQGEVKTFNLSQVTLKSGTNEIDITLRNPNGIPDVESNNSFVFTTVLDKSNDLAPLRMTFDNSAEVSWLVASQNNSLNWESVATTKEQSLTYRSFTNTQLGQESWLVSPILDLSAGTFSMFFDVSYAQNTPADDRLRILASSDCGVTYGEVIMDRAASSFSSGNSSVEWYPGNNDDWLHQYVNISSLAGKKNVRLAYVVQNDNGNNLFLDNIELFSGDDPHPPVTSSLYKLYYSTSGVDSNVAITFNLSTREDVHLQIFAMQGNILTDTILHDTLNQTYYYDFSAESSGIYLFRLLIGNQPSVTKVFIGH